MVGNKSASAVRAEAARRATEAAEQRERDGDPEGAGVLRELARDIRAIRIEGAATDRAKADHMTSPSDTPAAPDVGEITREWFERKVALEGDLEIGAGVRGKRTMTLNLTPEELAALEALAGPDWKSHALTAEAALASSATETARLREERDGAIGAWSASSDQWAAALIRAVRARDAAEAEKEAMRVERDEAVKLLEQAKDWLHNPFEPNNQCKSFEAISTFLASLSLRPNS